MEELRHRYTSDQEVALSTTDSFFRLLCTPPSDVVVQPDFVELVESTFFTENEEMVQKLINYFEDNWTGKASEVLLCSLLRCGTV